MLKRVLPALTLCFLSLPASSQTTADAAPQPVAAVPAAGEVEPVPQTVLVTGSRPGPGLWKVSKGEHVMWVFGTYSPLPANIEWRSRAVEKVIAGSQEYIRPPRAGFGVGWIGAMTALPFLLGVTKNPDGAELKDVLPADVYARWQPLKQKYFAGDDSIERQRPMFVAAQLNGRAQKAAGLSGGNDVFATITELVQKHKIKTTDAGVHIEIKELGKAVRELKKSAMNDAPCLAQTIAKLDIDVDIMRARANAWALGELEDIRKLDYTERDACFDAVTNSSIGRNQPEILTVKVQAAAKWVAAAEKALASNTSTFTVVEIKDILDPKGVIATLQGKGYTVEPPK